MRLGSVAGLLGYPQGVDVNIGRIRRAAELGLEVVAVWFDGKEAAYMASVAESAAKLGIELRSGTNGRFGSANLEYHRIDIEKAIAKVREVNLVTGIKYWSINCEPMALHNRWSPDPPLDERIDMIAVNLAKVADGIADIGVIIALENHCDYRGYECAQMLAKGNRPNLRAQLDTGNAFAVFEEPLEAAKAMAKWTVSVHFKDIKVTPIAPPPGRGSRTEPAPLGAGHIDLLGICRVLQDLSPEPKTLPLIQEAMYVPEGESPEEFMRTGLAWCKENLGEYLS